MTEFRFTVLDIQPEPYATTPNLIARIGLENLTGEPVHAAALRCQVRIEPQRRGYGDVEEELLLDIFGRRPQWSDTVRPFSWLHTGAMVQGFSTETEFDLPLACSYDFEVAASKYLHALRDGELPLVFLFNGTVFGNASSGFAVRQLSWAAEAGYRMPVAVWQSLMRQHFPNSAWLRLSRQSFEALQHYRTTHALLDWDDTLAALLHRASDGQASDGQAAGGQASGGQASGVRSGGQP